MKILLALIIFCTQAFTLNRGDLRDQIREKLEDTGPTAEEYYWTDTRLNNKINIIQRDIIARTDCMRRRYFIDTDTDTATYVLSTTTLKVYEVYYEDSNSTGTYKKLYYTNTKRLDIDYDNWDNTDGGTPLEWYQLFISTWDTSELRIGVYPPPAGIDAGENKLRVDFSEQALDMTSDSDIPFNGNPRLYPYHLAIMWGCAALIEPSQANTGNYMLLIDILQKNLLEVPAREGGITPRRR